MSDNKQVLCQRCGLVVTPFFMCHLCGCKEPPKKEIVHAAPLPASLPDDEHPRFR